MSAPLGVSDWQRAAKAHEQVLVGQADLTARKLRENEQASEALVAREQAARTELVQALFPALTAEAVARAADWSGYLGLRQQDPLAERASIEARLLARIPEIEAEPAFRDRVALRDPDTGTLTRELAEAREHLRPLAEVVARAEHPRLTVLLTAGYGTKEYGVAWWRLSYYSDWKAGDEVLERFPEYGEDFGKFREYYLDIRRAHDVHKAEVDRLQALWDAGVALQVEHATARLSLQTLDVDVLARTRARLAQFLVDTGGQSLGERLAGAPELELLAKRWIGLAQQVHYLQQLREHQLVPWQTRVHQELTKLRRKEWKYQRPKNYGARFTKEELERAFGDRSAKLAKRWKLYDRGFTNVTGFDRYADADLRASPLWWDLFNDGALAGSDLPGVARWRAEHPDYTYHRRRASDADEAAAAAAIAGADLAGGHEAGFTDAS